MNKTKNVFIVLGVARSGTSAITRALKALGIEIGNSNGPINAKWNPKGFWEDKEIGNIHAKVFTKLHFKPYGIELIDHSTQSGINLDELREEASTLLKQRFETTEHWGFKDPSTVKILHFWQSIFKRDNIQDHYVITLRNPLASAQSYKNLTHSQLDIETGLLIWLMHLFPAIEETHGKKRIIVNYDSMLQNPHYQLERIKKSLDIHLITDSSEIKFYVNEFLNKKFHHYEYSDEDLKVHSAAAVTPLCLQAYDLLLKLANDEITFIDEEFYTTWQMIKKELIKLYPTYCYIDTLLKRNKELETNIRFIQKSILWKISYPLRVIDFALRRNRKKIRESRKVLKAYG